MKARLQRKLQIAKEIERKLQVAGEIFFARMPPRSASWPRARPGWPRSALYLRPRSSQPADCAGSAKVRAKNAAGCRRCVPVRRPAPAWRRRSARRAQWSPAPSHRCRTLRAESARRLLRACCRSRRWPDREPKVNRAREPSPDCAITARASSSASMPSETQISRMRSIRSLKSTERKLKCWQREAMVAGILCDSVVQRMKTAHSGGSSMVFSRALKASLVIMCASSTMKIL